MTLPAVRLSCLPPSSSRKRIAAWASASICFFTTGCSSLFQEGAATGAGVAGTAVAAKVTRNPTVAAGIGLGVLAAAQAGVKTVERNYHGDQQDLIAETAGALSVGEVGRWRSHHAVQLERDEAGRVTVSRVISAKDLHCKEIVFSVDQIQEKVERSAFYVATICQDSARWRWASAEPATERWGALQ